MKTVEELQAMTQGELVAYVQSLQGKVDSLDKDKTYWYDLCLKTEEKLKAFREAVRSIVLLSD